tara:strand:+ start:249 stop:419 length:171 start_codon:yes stop_codon:yes gene_type:complete
MNLKKSPNRKAWVSKRYKIIEGEDDQQPQEATENNTNLGQQYLILMEKEGLQSQAI